MAAYRVAARQLLLHQLRYRAAAACDEVRMGWSRCIIPARNTWILKRRYDLPRSPIDGPPRELREPVDYTYEEVCNTDDVPPPPIEVIITEDVENIALKGDIVSVDRWLFRHHLRPAGSAVYKTAENMEEYADIIAAGEERRQWASQSPQSPELSPQSPELSPQSPELSAQSPELSAQSPELSAQSRRPRHQTVAGFTTVSNLKRLTLVIPMSAELSDWVVTRQHVRAAFRRAGYMVPDHCLEIPGEAGVTPGEAGVTPREAGVIPGEAGVTPGEAGVTPLTSRSDSKEMYVRVTVNKVDVVSVRCKVMLYSKEHGLIESQ